MPWVRFDDTFPVHRKVDGLSDTAFRLHVSAIFWCARNLTDGAVPEEDLELVTARVRAPARFATELVRRGLWHEAGHQCDSEHCPKPTDDGWVIHDYLAFQPSKDKVERERGAKAERQARWLAKRKGESSTGSPSSNGRDSPNSGASADATRDASQDDAPPRPAPKEAGRSPERPPPSALRAGNGDGRTTKSDRGSRSDDESRNPDWRSLPAFGAERDDDQVERAKRGLAALRAQIRTSPPQPEE